VEAAAEVVGKRCLGRWVDKEAIQNADAESDGGQHDRREDVSPHFSSRQIFAARQMP
jgi:hypothetical protein